MAEWTTVKNVLEDIYGPIENDDPRRTLAHGFLKDSFDKDKPDYIPSNLRKRNQTKISNKGNSVYSYQLKKEAGIILENLISIKKMLSCGRITAFNILHNKKKKEYIESKFKNSKKELEVLYKKLYYSVKNLDSVKGKILSDEFNPNTEVLSPDVKDISIIKLIADIKETALGFEDDLKKANYYVQLGSFDLAEEIIDGVLKESPDNGKAYYLKAFIFLLKNKNRSSEEINVNKDFFIILLKAYKFWEGSKKSKKNLITIMLYTLSKNNLDDSIFNDDKIKILFDEIIEDIKQNFAGLIPDLFILQVYLRTDTNKYNEYAKEWSKKIKNDPPAEILILSSQNENNIFKNHFQKNFSLKEQEDIINSLKKEVL